MKKSRFKPPYKSDAKKTNFRKSVKKAGVYIIKSRSTGKILYIGHSKSDLYTTMYRHFQSWEDVQKRTVYKNRNLYLVRVVYTSPQKAFKLEQALIKKYKPKDNPFKTALIGDKEYKKEIEKYIKENVRTDIPF